MSINHIATVRLAVILGLWLPESRGKKESLYDSLPESDIQVLSYELRYQYTVN
jgi:hypothetical protein